MIFKVLYFYFHLFYTKILVQPQPHLVTILALSFLESLIIVYLFDFIMISTFCIQMITSAWAGVFIAALLIIVNFIMYRNHENILLEKPKLFGSNFAAMLISIIFFLFSASLLFWADDVFIEMLINCR